jgi:Clp amino terminal domain, pathogenicity island component
MYPMRRESKGMLSPTPHYYEISGRAAEIARALGSPVGGAEHLFLGMLHDGGWPVSAISGLVELARAEAAVRGILDSPGYLPPPSPRGFGALAAVVPGVRHGYVPPSWGVGVAVEMGDSYLGVDHALLAMIRNRETVPARALAGLADLDALAAAVVEAMNAPVVPAEDAVFLPEGQQLDSPLSRAIVDALPEGTTFGFNGADGRTWIQVFGPGGSLGPEVSREVLNTALVSLGRPGLGS